MFMKMHVTKLKKYVQSLECGPTNSRCILGVSVTHTQKILGQWILELSKYGGRGSYLGHVSVTIIVLSVQRRLSLSTLLIPTRKIVIVTSTCLPLILAMEIAAMRYFLRHLTPIQKKIATIEWYSKKRLLKLRRSLQRRRSRLHALA